MGYAKNEIDIGYAYRERIVESKCLHEWRRMTSIVRMIQKRKYLNQWRRQNDICLNTICNLLNYPTKSRWHFLKIISTLRLTKKCISKRRYKLLLNRLFDRNRSVILFVLFSTWRSQANEQNIAAFKIVKILQKSDKIKITQSIQHWQYWTRKHRLQRLNTLDIAIKLALVNKKKRHFKQWMNAFVDAANNKISLFFWCHSVQSNVFDHWRQCLLWYTAAN